MPKIRTHKGAAKRVRQSSTGKLLHEHAFGRHFNSKKRQARRRNQAGVSELVANNLRNMKRKLGA